MFDWMTLSIELVGLAVLCIWIVLPAREFRVIVRRLKEQNAQRNSSSDRRAE